jgi:lipopolysaccharide biosynthesis glycosyltransferase
VAISASSARDIDDPLLRKADSNMAADLAVCYVADRNFILGTLISVRSLRQFVPAALAEIHVFYLDPDAAVLQRLQCSLARYGATVVPLHIDDRIDLASKTWNRTHVPHAALGRFYIEPHLPAHIERILYIDGDTFFAGDPTELLRYVPPEHGIAAAEDISFFACKDWGRYGSQTRAYFAGLGIDGSRGYLNSGLILARRQAWKDIAAEAADYFINHSDTCRYHDQSALNAVVGARRVRLSPKWNFQTPFCYWNMREEVAPIVFHFTEFPKPWMGNVVPWGFLRAAISESMEEFSALALPTGRLSETDEMKFNRVKADRARRLATRMPLRLLRRRRQLRKLIAIADL